jgi:ATP-dependent RNA helicase DDX10/DBP4
MTAIQQITLPYALCGRDILAGAKTGSGKTIAFLLPLIEELYRSNWNIYDGLGGLILLPTRELAMQILDEMSRIGKYHTLSAGLIIGGKRIQEEAKRIHRMNILVSTPGRLLQHLNETYDLISTNLKVFILDETDRILDYGFTKTLDAILHELPQQKQTLLFSATQSMNIRELARLSLRNAKYCCIHADSTSTTPIKLKQVYTVCELQDKLNVLWSFIKTHLKCKVLVFFTTCNQVRFVFEAFSKLRPGVPLRCMTGRMKQMKRLLVYYEFCNNKNIVLFATDIASRGLDFATVDWILQVDCPEDSSQYIHRVGRTARSTSAGRAMIILLPQEKHGMLRRFNEHKIPIKFIQMNSIKWLHITSTIQALISRDPELNTMARHSIVSYVKGIYQMKNKDVFNIQELPITQSINSLGLCIVPRLHITNINGRTGSGPRFPNY